MLNFNFTVGSGYVVPLGGTNTTLIDITENKKDAFNRVIKIQNLPASGYQVRVRRLNTSTPDVDEEYRDYFKCVYFSLTGVTNLPVINLPRVNEQDCKIARSAYKFESSSKTNGQIDGISGVVQTIARIWNGSNWNTLAPTNNPASLFLYVLTHPANAYRIEETEITSRVDLYTLRKWYEYCENPQDIVPATSVTADKKFQFNNVMDGSRSVLDILRDICAAGRASPAIMDGKWTIIIDKPRVTVAQHFTPHNSWGFESTKAMPRLPHAFRAVFRDEDNGYQEKEQVVYNNGYTVTTAEIFEEISFPGVTNRGQIINHCRWHLAQAMLRPERYTLNTDFEYLVCNRGDLVKVMHDVPMWGLHSGRIKEQVDGDTLLLDEPVTLNAGVSYTIRIRTESGASITRTLSSITTTGVYSSINLTTTLNSVEGKAGNLFILGLLNQESHDLVVLNIEPMDNKNARLTLVDYSSEIYTLDLASNYPIPAFNPDITRPPNLDVKPILTYPIILTDGTGAPSIRSDVGVMDISAGILNISISVVYNLIAEFSNTINRVEICYSNSSSPSKESIYRKIDIAEGASNILISGVTKGDVYTIKLRYIDTMNRTGPWSPEVTHTVVGKTDAFDTLNSLVITRVHKNLVITPVIVNRSTDFSNYEFRIVQSNLSTIAPAGTLVDFWNMNVPYIKVTSIDATTVDLMQFSSPRVTTDGITYSVACRAMDYLGNYSETSRLGQITIKPLAP